MSREYSTIERSPEFLFHRARMNREERRPLDALELLRAAVERDPEKPEYRMELASLYAELGCMRQSDELVLDALARGETGQSWLYQLALNRLAERDLPRALHAVQLFMKDNPDNADALSRNIRWHLWMEGALARDTRHAQDAFDRACEALKDGDMKRADALAEVALKRIPEWKQALAVRAAARLSMGDEKEARELALRASAGSDVSVRSLVLSAQVMLGLNDQNGARSMLMQAAQMATDDADIWMTIRGLETMGLHEDIAALTSRAAHDRPFDRWFLHARAVSLIRTENDLKGAARCWARILRMDPEDGVAWHYHEAAASGTLAAEELTYEYRLPEEVANDWVTALIELHQRGGEAVARAWRENRATRRQVRWALQCDAYPFRILAVTMMMTADKREAVRVLHERMTSPLVEKEDRSAFYNLCARLEGAPIDFHVDLATPEEWVLSDADLDLAQFTIGEKQALRYAAQVIDERYGIRTLPSLTLLYMAYRQKVDRREDALLKTEPLCAALALTHLTRIHKKTSVKALSKAFGCSPRQVRYYSLRLMHAIQGVSEIHEDL